MFGNQSNAIVGDALRLFYVVDPYQHMVEDSKIDDVRFVGNWVYV